MARSTKQLAEHINTRFIELKQIRQSWEPGWRDIARYQIPQRGDFFRSPNQGNRGSKKDQAILDMVASDALRVLRAGLMNGLTSRTQPWFRLTVPEPKVANNAAVKTWLDHATERMLMVFGQSNLYEALHLLYGEVGGFGTGCALMMSDREDVMRLYSQTIGTYWLANDDRNETDTFIREFAMPARNVIRRYGEDKVSPDVAQKKGKAGADGNVMLIHCIEPNDEYEPGSFGSRGKKWRSVTWEKGKDDRLLLTSGYERWPVLAPKWEVLSDDPYGTGCGHAADSDVKSLQILGKRQHMVVDKHANPPMLFPAELKNQATGTIPGFINYVAGNIRDKMGGPLYQTDASAIAPLKDLINEERDIVRRCYHADAFLMISQMEGVQPRNQLEIMARQQEKLTILGPVLESLHGDLLKPLVDWAFDELYRHRLFDPPPRELDGWPLDIELISMVAQAQNASRVQSIERTVGFIGGLSGVFPQAGDKLDVYEAIDKHADAVGAPAGVIRPTNKAEEIAANRAKQAAATQAIQTGSALAAGAKTLSEAQVGDRNGLEAVMGVQPMAEAA